MAAVYSEILWGVFHCVCGASLTFESIKIQSSEKQIMAAHRPLLHLSVRAYG